MPYFPGTAMPPPLPPLPRPTLQQRLKARHPLVVEPPEAVVAPDDGDGEKPDAGDAT
ncbi:MULTISPECIES: hypothetical protein [Streptomyces]|uniref:Uncharacterized protein n=1 Tax=Streptomyces abikoensis TaxID=97398 RepID=A0ABW7T064_9ACTN|nr:hypothetical protein [Streptomyces luteoverticillatus]